MNKFVIDASAIIALIKNEPGSSVVETLLGSMYMSSINISEAVAMLCNAQMTVEKAKACIEPLITRVIDFDREQAYLTADLKKQTKHLGLSLGDRACLALGQTMQLPIYTADKIWGKLEIDGIDVRLIR